MDDKPIQPEEEDSTTSYAHDMSADEHPHSSVPDSDSDSDGEASM